MDKQDFYNNYSRITDEVLSSNKLPFLKESLEKVIAEMQKLSDSLKGTISSFLSQRTNSLNNPDDQFSNDYKNMLSSLIENFKEIEVSFTESKKIITELEQNYTEKECDFLPALEKQVFEIVYNNFTDNIPIFTYYLANYKEWLEDPNNLPNKAKEIIKKNKSALDAAALNNIIKQKILISRQNQQKQQNKK